MSEVTTGRSRKHRQPRRWSIFRLQTRHRWVRPFLFIDWLAQWAVYGLRQLSILELLETCSSFTLLVGLIFYFTEAPERTKSKHYQAWQVINTAQGKGGSGGRTDALQDLNDDKVPLVGVDVADSFLQGVQLEHADLRRSNFHGADLKGADLRYVDLEQAAMGSANLRNAKLDQAKFTGTNLYDADLAGASLAGAKFTGTVFDRADLRGADLTGIEDWQSATYELADIHGVINPPAGYVKWALLHGAVDIESDAAWVALIKNASLPPLPAKK